MASHTHCKCKKNESVVLAPLEMGPNRKRLAAPPESVVFVTWNSPLAALRVFIAINSCLIAPSFADVVP